jgi:hypothetical protein
MSNVTTVLALLDTNSQAAFFRKFPRESWFDLRNHGTATLWPIHLKIPLALMQMDRAFSRALRTFQDLSQTSIEILSSL